MRVHLIAALALSCALLPAAASADVDVLAWSFANTNVTVCTVTCATATNLDSEFIYDWGWNATSSSADPNGVFGSAVAFANPGSGALALPQLHAAVIGGISGSSFANNRAILQGLQLYRWNGAAMTLDPTAFVATLNFSDLGGVSFEEAGLAIVDASIVPFHSTLADVWSASTSNFSWAATCATPGAVSLGSEVTSNPAQPSGPLTVTMSGCGTYVLNPGTEFYIWGRMAVVHGGAGSSDAEHTFDVMLNPNLSPETQRLLLANLEVVQTVPEPATWVTLIAGFGLIGAMLRRRPSPLWNKPADTVPG